MRLIMFTGCLKLHVFFAPPHSTICAHIHTYRQFRNTIQPNPPNCRFLDCLRKPKNPRRYISSSFSFIHVKEMNFKHFLKWKRFLKINLVLKKPAAKTLRTDLMTETGWGHYVTWTDQQRLLRSVPNLETALMSQGTLILISLWSRRNL